jgi:hypothetical protein
VITRVHRERTRESCGLCVTLLFWFVIDDLVAPLATLLLLLWSFLCFGFALLIEAREKEDVLKVPFGLVIVRSDLHLLKGGTMERMSQFERNVNHSREEESENKMKTEMRRYETSAERDTGKAERDK